jgi:NHLM bacteriocin system ABC transporter ATP-binding protein
MAAVALQQVYLTRLEIRLALTESVKFLQHVLRLPVAFYQYRFAGDIVSRVLSTARVARLISGELATTVVSLLSLVFFVAALLPVDRLLTVVGVAIGSLNLIVLRWFSRWRIDQNRSIEQIRGRLAGGIMWAIQIIESVKATGSESDLMVRWTGDQARVASAEQELGAYDALLLAIPPLLATLTTIVVLGLGGRQVALGSLSIGALVAFQTVLASFNQPFRDLARLGSQVQDLRADLDRIDDVRRHRIDPLLEISPPSPSVLDGQERRGGLVPLPRLSGRLELSSVTFGYNRTVEEPLIKDFSLVIRPGQRIALVGRSGSGKSTLARLITGLYQPWSGSILYDGKAITELPRELFVSSVALVDERIAMFQGTVRDNLTLWDEFVSSERLIQAGLSAAIHRDLLHRRGGFDAAVAEGARNFSGGQRQRLEIARSLVRDPSLLVLDEATSALDPRTEAIVEDHLRRRGCTCLIIAHRLSAIRDCDEILVLSGGRIVERGTHDELKGQPRGEYASLLASQEVASRQGESPSIHRWTLRQLRPAEAIVGEAGTPVNARPASSALPPVAGITPASDSPDPALGRSGYLIEELLPFSCPEHTSANHPLPLDDPESVWWVRGGQVDLFFTLPGLNGEPGRRRHLCRVDDGGSIFAISGVRGRLGGGLLAVGVGQADLLRFARGDLIRLSFDEPLAEQVSLLIDDWILRIGRVLNPGGTPPDRRQLVPDVVTDLTAGARYGVREGVGWVRHLQGSSEFKDEAPLPVSEMEARFPLSEHLWLTAGEDCRVTCTGTLAMIRSGDPWEGLRNFHRAALDDMARAQEREARHSWSELQTVMTGQRTVLTSVSTRLASVANETTVPLERTDGDALLTACRAVGREAGIEVRSPRKSTEPEETEGGETLEEIARASGFHLRPITLPHDWVARGGMEPLLARRASEGNQPLALLPRRGLLSSRHYDVYDPVIDRRRPIDLREAEGIAPAAWTFYRTLPDLPLRLADLLRFSFAGVGREVRLVCLLAALGGLLGLALPIGSGVLVDQVIPEVGLPGSARTRLLALTVFLASLAVSIAVFQVVQGLALVRIQGKVVPSIIPAVWDRLLRLPVRFFGEFSSGDLAMRTMGLALIFKKISGAAATTLVTGLISLFNLGLLFWYSWRLALGSLILLSIMLLVILVYLARQIRQEARIQKVEGTIIGFLLEVVGGINKLRTAGAENRAFARWATCYADQLALQIRARRLSNGLHLFLAGFPILIAILIYVGAIHLDPTRLSTGHFLALTIAVANLTASVLAVSHTLLGLLDVPPLYDRIRPVLQATPEFPSAVLEPVRLGGSLALSSVSFHYPGQDEGTKVLDDVSIQLRPGEFVAIVGASGSGKSTLMRLLLGFETPDAGTVTYDGRELATLDVREVRRQIGVVLQTAQLMPGDIFSNIVGFASGLTMDDAWQAARLAGLEEEIRQLPMGMHTVVGEGGGNLSGGQRQRLLIARALVRRPRILMFDEATSALDNTTQAIVTQSITRDLRGVTRLVIAHRLTTVEDADRIYVVKKGRIVQSGQYHQLLEEPGPFQELLHRQLA